MTYGHTGKHAPEGVIPSPFMQRIVVDEKLLNGIKEISGASQIIAITCNGYRSGNPLVVSVHGIDLKGVHDIFHSMLNDLHTKFTDKPKCTCNMNGAEDDIGHKDGCPLGDFLDQHKK